VQVRQGISFRIIMGIAVCGMLAAAIIPVAFGAEQQSPSDLENATPLGAISRPTPPIITVEGSITELDLESDTPSLSLVARDGHETDLQLDRSSTIVWKKHKKVKLSDLKTGVKVKVRYMEKHKKLLAKTIDIV